MAEGPGAGRGKDGVAKLVLSPAARPAGRSAALALGLVVVQLAGVAGANLVANPRGEFPTTYYKPLVGDYGLIKLRLFEAAPSPTWVVIGSSRAVSVPASGLPWSDGPGFNFALPGGRPADYLLLAHYLREHAPDVKGVMLAIDNFAPSQSASPRRLSRNIDCVSARATDVGANS